jgi:hypothetical protein
MDNQVFTYFVHHSEGRVHQMTTDLLLLAIQNISMVLLVGHCLPIRRVAFQFLRLCHNLLVGVDISGSSGITDVVRALEVDLEVPDHLKGTFAEMPSVFKNTHVSRDDIGDHMKTYQGTKHPVFHHCS